VPDGTKCEPNTKFNKTWLLKNTGKIDWSERKFPVKLLCTGGNLRSISGEYVTVAETTVNETASVSVEFLAPPVSGPYFSEWTLACNGFRFGPRVWCTIEVTDDTRRDAEARCNVIDAKNMSKSAVASLGSSIDSTPMATVSPTSATNDDSLYKKIDSATRSTSINSNSSAKCDDLDDEFVVVPACFDLSKKWKPTAAKKSLSDATDDAVANLNELESCNSSFYMEKIDEDDKQSTASSKYIVSSTKDEKEPIELNCSFSTINQDEDNGDDDDKDDENDNERQRLRASSNGTLNEEPKEQQPPHGTHTPIVQSSTDATLAQQQQSTASANESENANAIQQQPVESKSPKSNDYLSTLKNALSNMAGPAYVSSQSSDAF
jgi:hypothetical protein